MIMKAMIPVVAVHSFFCRKLWTRWWTWGRRLSLTLWWRTWRQGRQSFSSATCIVWAEMCTWMDLPSLNTLFLVHRLTPHSLPWFLLVVYANLIPGHPAILTCFFFLSFHLLPLSPLSIHSYTTYVHPSLPPTTPSPVNSRQTGNEATIHLC